MSGELQSEAGNEMNPAVLEQAKQTALAMQQIWERGRQFVDFPRNAAKAAAQVALGAPSIAEGCHRIVAECYSDISELRQASDETHKQAIVRLADYIRPHVSRCIELAPDNGCRALLELALSHVEWMWAADQVRVKFLREMFKA